jgi:hypothetical protein
MKSVVLCALLTALCLPQLAAAHRAPIQVREARQEARIDAAWRRGELSPQEARRLDARLRHIDRVEWRYRSNDGRLGPYERIDLHRRLDRSSAVIYRQVRD